MLFTGGQERSALEAAWGTTIIFIVPFLMYFVLYTFIVVRPRPRLLPVPVPCYPIAQGFGSVVAQHTLASFVVWQCTTWSNAAASEMQGCLRVLEGWSACR